MDERYETEQPPADGGGEDGGTEGGDGGGDTETATD